MASIFRSFPLLRQVAPRLSRRLFTCRSCQNGTSRSLSGLPGKSPFLKAFRTGTRQASTASTAALSETVHITSPLSSLSKTINGGQIRRTFFPEVSDKVVAYWLLGSAASVFGIVVFGGLTRLTESGYVRFMITTNQAYVSQLEYHGMEASYWVYAPSQRSRLGFRIFEIPIVTRVQAIKSTYDSF